MPWFPDFVSAVEARRTQAAVPARARRDAFRLLTRKLTNVIYTSDYDDRRDARAAVRS